MTIQEPFISPIHRNQKIMYHKILKDYSYFYKKIIYKLILFLHLNPFRTIISN